MALYDEYAALRDRFEVFAFHNRSVRSLEELDEKMRDTVEGAWSGRNLPFPTLLDATGLTYRSFSVRSLGTAVLIDPEGNVVRGDAEAMLAEALQRAAGKAAETPDAPPASEAPPAGSGGETAAPAAVEPAAAEGSAAPRIAIHGRVRDVDGEPAPGVRLALQWSFRGGVPSPRWPPLASPPDVVSDDLGHFTAVVDLRYAPLGLVGLDMARRLGARSVIPKDYDGAVIELVLEPLVHVFGTFADDIPGLPLTSSYAYVGIPGVRTGVAEDLSPAPAFSLDLPPGEYRFRFSGTDRKYLWKRLTLDAEAPEHDLGTLVLPPKPIALLYGKEPPTLNVTAARGVAPEVQCSDYRGRWLLIEFWGHW